MKTKRKWSVEEKLAILKEVSEQGVVVTCNKYGIFPSSYYSWKEKLSNGNLLPDVKRRSRDFKKLEKENALLKKLLAEKELELAMAMERLKKKRRARMS